MTDQTLAKLIEDAEAHPADAGALMALTDRLSEASPQDRMEALARWVKARAELADVSASLAQARQGIDHRLRHAERSRNGTVVPREGSYSADFCRHAERELRHGAFAFLRDGLQDGRWYAVRFTPSSRLSFYGPRPETELLAEMQVAPLDGGQILKPGERT